MVSAAAEIYVVCTLTLTSLSLQAGVLGRGRALALDSNLITFATASARMIYASRI